MGYAIYADRYKWYVATIWGRMPVSIGSNWSEQGGKQRTFGIMTGL